MWAFLANLIAVIANALKLWHDDKLRNEGREEAVRDAEKVAEQNEATAAAASTDPVILDRVRARFDRSRRAADPADQ